MKRIVFVDNSQKNLEKMLRSVMNVIVKNKMTLGKETVEISFLHVRWALDSDDEYKQSYNKTRQYLIDQYKNQICNVVSLDEYHFCDLQGVEDEEKYAISVKQWACELTESVRGILREAQEYLILLDVSLYHEPELEGLVFAKNANGTLSRIVRNSFMPRCIAYTQYVNSVIQHNWEQETSEVPLERDVHFDGKINKRLQAGIVSHLFTKK